MADWIFDEDITRVTIEKFNKAGIKGLHIEYDLGEGGRSDDEVLEIAKKEKKTLITANTRDFISKHNTQFYNTHGAFILNTADPAQQVKLVKATIKVARLDTLNKRKEKKVYIKEDEVDILDTRTNVTETVKLPKKGRK